MTAQIRATLASAVLLSSLWMESDANACGCFALPSPANTVVQAGERILFAKEQDHIVAYIQVQYQGSADQFGWLLPLPSLPSLELGTDELFTQLQQWTQPQYLLTTTRQFCDGSNSSRTSSAGGCFGSLSANRGDSPSTSSDLGAIADASSSALVLRASVGPYDYAVLKADDRSEMLKWLSDNRFFIPAGTDEAVAPYIHPGAYFLALKLRAGESAGDIVPVVVRYRSDLPMIPIILTQVGAVPNMGIQVFLLGEARAVPRNYHHLVLNEMPVWLSRETYQNLVIRAVGEAPKRHAFITEYAGSSRVMRDRLDYPGRFGDLNVLRATEDAAAYLRYLKKNGYLFDATLFGLLENYLPIPAELASQGVTAQIYYANFDLYQGQLSQTDGGAPPPAFDSLALTSELETRIVVPTRKSAALFYAHPYLTRLYTVLSPEDMTDDPVFGENRDLADVELAHGATVTIPCQGTSWIRSDDGLESQFVTFSGRPTVAASLRVEILREEGAPEVVIDNRDSIVTALGPVDYGRGPSGSVNRSGNVAETQSRGCGVSGLAGIHWGTLLLVAGAVLGLLRPRRRKI